MTMPEEARAELREAIRILKEDGVHIHKTYAKFQASLTGKSEEKPLVEEEKTSKEGEPPPVKEKEEKPPPRDFWFGTRGN